MLIATWIILFIFVVLSYFYYKKDLTGPLFLLCAAMLLCFTIVCMNYENWDMQVHGFRFLTTITFVVAIGSFFIGTLCSRALLSYRKNLLSDSRKEGIMERTSGQYPYRLFAALSLFFLMAYCFVKFQGVSLSSFSSFRASLREIYSADKEYNFFTTQLFEILVAIGYISMHRLVLDKFVHKKKINFMVFVPLGSFMIYALLSTDRNILIRFFLFGVLLFMTTYEWKKSVFARNKKLLVKVGAIVAVFALVFWAFGRMKNYKSNFERSIGIYAGSGLYAYNLWLEDFDEDYTEGKHSFSVVQNTLAAVGIGQESDVPHNSEYIIYESPNGYTFATNIYSTFRPYYQDFGMAGVAIIPGLMGVLFEFLYLLNKKDKFGFWWIFYTSHVYPVVYYPILEQFLKRFHFGLVYEIWWLVFFYFLVYAKEGLWRVKVSAQQ